MHAYMHTYLHSNMLMHIYGYLRACIDAHPKTLKAETLAPEGYILLPGSRADSGRLTGRLG